MKRILPLLFVFGLVAALLSGCQQPSPASSYTDDMGRTIRLDKAPQRIVSHVPPITETLYAMGLGDRVVGRSDYDDYPAEVLDKPSVGNYFNPSIEKIVSLQPDLVVTDGHSENIKQLDNLNIPYVVIDPKDFDGIYRDITLLGQIAGVESKANKLINEMKQSVAAVQEKTKNAPRVRTFYVIDATDLNQPWTAGPGSFIDGLINMAGGENVASMSQSAYAQLSIEQIVKSDPQLIILPASHGTAFTPETAFEQHAGWRETTAVKQKNVKTIDGDLVDGYGPRLVQGLQEVAKLIHPELFK